MRAKRIPFAPVKNEVVLMDGGLNENVSSLELKGGELISGYNYQLTEGTQGGYVSVAGYERFDGQTKPSSITATDTDHTAQDAARAAIGEVPGIGQVLGVHLFDGDVYAFRNKVGGATAGMYVSTSSGWSEISTAADPLEPDGAFNFVNYNFKATTDTLAMYWTDGENKARYYDGTSVVVIDNSGMDPDDKPINLEIHNNRLFLAYPSGSLQYSNVGDPTDWTTGAGEIGVGKEITDLLSGVGNALIIYCDEAIRVLNGIDIDEWQLESFSDVSGAYVHTAKRILGTAFFMDDRGVTSLTAVQDFGDFEANSISQKIKRTLEDNKGDITCATVARELNQYRLFFNTGGAIFFSFLSKKLRGVTIINYDTPVYSVTEGVSSEGSNEIYFTSTDGYVYQMDSGTSFDGEPIETYMQTSFYHYRSPRSWKRFKALTFEIASTQELDIMLRTLFDYSGGYVPKSIQMEMTALGFGSRYGEGVWGTMRYSGAELTNRVRETIKGMGANMCLVLATSETYKSQHTIQNVITDYEISGRQL